MTMESDIRNWVFDRLSHNLPEFNDMPACPYAKQAILDGKVHMEEVDDFLDAMSNYVNNWPVGIEVVVLGMAPEKITPRELTYATVHATQGFLSEMGYIALEDHPHDVEDVAGYEVNQGNWALILLQEKAKLANARDILAARGYYKNWDEDYYREVVLNRS